MKIALSFSCANRAGNPLPPWLALGKAGGVAVLLHTGMEKGKKTPEPWSSYRGLPGAFSQTNAEKAKLNTQLSAA